MGRLPHYYIRSGAFIPDDDRYRYDLLRMWREDDKHLLWIMLNPSTADATKDDATIRKCVGFTERLGYSALYVVNLFAYRSRHPGELLSVRDPIGPRCDEWIEVRAQTQGCAWRVIAAWGSLDFCPRFRDRAARVLQLLDGHKVMCLGTSKSGDPRHPSRIGYDTPLEPFTLGRKSV